MVLLGRRRILLEIKNRSLSEYPKRNCLNKIYHKSHFINEGGLEKLPIHYFYYMIRNKYWFWGDHIKGFKKISFLRKYLAKCIREAGVLRDMSLTERMNACLDGVYCALNNTGGRWGMNSAMPGILKTKILKFPFLWADLLEFNFTHIIAETLRRIKAKLFKVNKYVKS